MDFKRGYWFVTLRNGFTRAVWLACFDSVKEGVRPFEGERVQHGLHAGLPLVFPVAGPGCSRVRMGAFGLQAVPAAGAFWCLGSIFWVGSLSLKAGEAGTLFSMSDQT